MAQRDPYADNEAVLKRLGLERTRENYLMILYADPPETWDEEAEEQLPPDLRLYPVPDVPFPDET
jgi:hypothetical protein